MMNDILISIDDFQRLIPLAENIDYNRLDSAIIEAQRQFIRPSIGRELYRLLHINATDTRFAELLEGTDYINSGEEIDFFGLKPAIAYYAYAILLKRNNFRVERSGNKNNQAEQSRIAEQAQVNQEYRSALEEGANYLNEALQFLHEKQSTYPEFDCRYAPQTAFSITSITQGRFGRNEENLRRYYDKKQYYGG